MHFVKTGLIHLPLMSILCKYPCLAVILLAVGLPLTPASAAEDERQGAGLGIGGEACSIYLTTYEHNPDSVDDDHDVGDEGVHHEANYTSSDYIHWLQGYLSAYQWHENYGKDVTIRVNMGGILNYLYRRCSENPDAAFYTMMPALLERLKPE
jgi:hypothetical protein